MDQKVKICSCIFKNSNSMLIEKLEKMQFGDKSKDYTANLKPICIDEFNKMINKALEDSEHSNVTNARVLKESVKEWI